MNHLSVTVEKILPATFQEVFDARLNPGGLREWMRPGPGGEIVNTSTYPILERLVMSGSRGSRHDGKTRRTS